MTIFWWLLALTILEVIAGSPAIGPKYPRRHGDGEGRARRAVLHAPSVRQKSAFVHRLYTACPLHIRRIGGAAGLLGRRGRLSINSGPRVFPIDLVTRERGSRLGVSFFVR